MRRNIAKDDLMCKAIIRQSAGVKDLEVRPFIFHGRTSYKVTQQAPAGEVGKMARVTGQSRGRSPRLGPFCADDLDSQAAFGASGRRPALFRLIDVRQREHESL